MRKSRLALIYLLQLHTATALHQPTITCPQGHNSNTQKSELAIHSQLRSLSILALHNSTRSPLLPRKKILRGYDPLRSPIPTVLTAIPHQILSNSEVPPVYERISSSPDRWSEEAEAASRPSSSSGRRTAASSSYESRPAGLPGAIPGGRRRRRLRQAARIGGAVGRGGGDEVGDGQRGSDVEVGGDIRNSKKIIRAKHLSSMYQWPTIYPLSHSWFVGFF